MAGLVRLQTQLREVTSAGAKLQLLVDMVEGVRARRDTLAQQCHLLASLLARTQVSVDALVSSVMTPCYQWGPAARMECAYVWGLAPPSALDRRARWAVCLLSAALATLAAPSMAPPLLKLRDQAGLQTCVPCRLPQ